MKAKELHIFFSIFLSTFFCFGQTTSDSVHLKPFTVSADRVVFPRSYRSIRFDSLQLAQNKLSTLSDLLSSGSSVYIKEYGQGGLSSISLRGTGANHTQLYWNGVSINSPMLGQVDLSLFPLAFFEDVELNEGAASLINGSGGLGGSLKISSRANWEQKDAVSIHSSLGSFGTFTNQLALRVRPTEKWQLKSVIFHKTSENNFTYRDYHQNNQDFKRENADFEQKGFLQEIYKMTGSNGVLSFKSWYYDSDRNLPTILGTSSNGERQLDVSHKNVLGWEHRLGRRLFDVKLAYVRDELDYFNDTLVINSNSDIESYQIISRYQKFILKNLKFSLQGQIRQDKAKTQSYSGEKEQKLYSIYNGFSYTAGSRFTADIYSREELYNDDEIFWLPSFGFNYQLKKSKKWFLKTSIAKNLRYPTLNDLFWGNQGNEDLRVERSKTVEASLFNNGMKWIGNNSFKADVTGYYSLVDNWIIWYPENGVWRPENLRKVKSQGVEVTVDYKKTNANSVFGVLLNYGHTRSEIIETNQNSENTLGKQLIYVPLHKISGTLSYKKKGWFAWYRQAYNDKTFIDNQNQTYLPYYAVADVSFGREWTSNIADGVVQFEIRNVYNEEYQVIAERPMPGRNYILSLKFQFSRKNER